MSGQGGEPPPGQAGEPPVLAGEYVLGLLDGVAMRQIEAQAAQDPALAREIAFWEDRLAPLTGLVAPVPAPSVLWSRLALATGIGERRFGGEGSTRRPGGARTWQAATAASLAMAAGFAFLAFLPQPPAPSPAGVQFVAALAPMNAAAPFLAQARTDGSIAVTRLAAAAIGPGRDLQLWALPKGASRPVSLGVLPPAGAVLRPADRPLADTQLLLSDEPAGGSPTGLPTGAVLYGGALAPLTPPIAPGR